MDGLKGFPNSSPTTIHHSGMSIALDVGAFYHDGDAFAGYVQHRALVPNDSIEGPAFLEVRLMPLDSSESLTCVVDASRAARPGTGMRFPTDMSATAVVVG
jgi:hypothetical protein